MVNNEKEHRKKKPARQAFQESVSEPNKIVASTPYEFKGKNLTAYGGLLPVATMLEKLGFQALVEETISCSPRDASDELVQIRIEHRAGSLYWISTIESTPLHRR
jgi:hypothetical protein